MDVKNQVLNQYHSLKKSSQEIADTLLTNPNIFLTKNAQELGKLTNTSAASIIRFCKQLNYKGLKDFQIELAKSWSQKKKKPEEINMIVTKNDRPGTIMTKLRVSLTKNIEDTVRLIDIQSLNQAVALLEKAKSIYLEGIAGSSFAAKDLFYKLIRSGRNVYYNDDVHLALERAYYSRKKDLMICFSYSGQTTELLLAARQAKKNKTPIIAVTRDHDSPLSRIASLVLALPDNENLLRVGAINSTSAEMFISNLLYLSTITQDLTKVKREMEETRELTKQLKEGND